MKKSYRRWCLLQKLLIYLPMVTGHFCPQGSVRTAVRRSIPQATPKAICQMFGISKIAKIIDISAEPDGEGCPSPVALLMSTRAVRRIYLRTGRGVTYSSLSSGKGVWRYLIYKDVEQRSLTSLAYYIPIPTPLSEASGSNLYNTPYAFIPHHHKDYKVFQRHPHRAGNDRGCSDQLIQ